MHNPNPLLDQLGQVLESALNAIIALDPFAADYLQKMEGQSLELVWADTPLRARLQVVQGKIVVGPSQAKTANLSITSSLAALASVAIARMQNAGMPAGKIQMSGDLGLAHTLSELAEKFEPDFDLPFANTFGNVWGPQIAGVLRAAFNQARKSGKQVIEDIGAYVRDESRDGVARGEYEQFADEVELIRNRAERLVDRVQNLTASVTRSKPESSA